jgi:hypothetical protein
MNDFIKIGDIDFIKIGDIVYRFDYKACNWIIVIMVLVNIFLFWMVF